MLVLIVWWIVASAPNAPEGELTSGDTEEEIAQDLKTLESGLEGLDEELAGIEQELADLEAEIAAE